MCGSHDIANLPVSQSANTGDTAGLPNLDPPPGWMYNINVVEVSTAHTEYVSRLVLVVIKALG